ncbi:metalloproteinase inhibitor 2-like [Phyllopteryx taeniolatus]|uniref:metalloproteinase inhibitor 2-like n=1 Tax=Phyllopteryx taeniolatus TaxID=161469 RepID=UPI002AD3B198|nr:metalloproteinase inhibitor 2-like [Phyllopteryx taeniolatus]
MASSIYSWPDCSSTARRIISCDFSQPWETLSAMQKTLLRRYQMGCGCTIKLCVSLSCGVGSPTQCLWTDFLPVKVANGEQAQNFAFIKRSNGYCAWYRVSASPKKGFVGVKGR